MVWDQAIKKNIGSGIDRTNANLWNIRAMGKDDPRKIGWHAIPRFLLPETDHSQSSLFNQLLNNDFENLLVSVDVFNNRGWTHLRRVVKWR
jgi:hypothetical protein